MWSIKSTVNCELIGGKQSFTKKIYLNDSKMVGVIIGPKGSVITHIRRESGCSVHIRGKGSIRPPELEELLKNITGYGHLDDDLHILIRSENMDCIFTAEDIIYKLIHPSKRRRLE